MRTGDPTPWGPAQSITLVGRVSRIGEEGQMDARDRTIFFVSTASHGGYYVPKGIVSRIPAHRQAAAARYAPPLWYEEDCEWASVALAFPEYFPPDAQAHASAILDQRESR